MIYLIADLHINHEKIIQYCNRPFSSVNEMNEVLIGNWNDTISEDDKVFFLGDFICGPSKDILAKNVFDILNGKKIFLRGNHDRSVKSIKFVEKPIRFEYRGVKIICTHEPIDGYFPEDINIHGHIHNNYEIKSEKHFILFACGIIIVGVIILLFNYYRVAKLVEFKRTII